MIKHPGDLGDLSQLIENEEERLELEETNLGGYRSGSADPDLDEEEMLKEDGGYDRFHAGGNTRMLHSRLSYISQTLDPVKELNESEGATGQIVRGHVVQGGHVVPPGHVGPRKLSGGVAGLVRNNSLTSPVPLHPNILTGHPPPQYHLDGFPTPMSPLAHSKSLERFEAAPPSLPHDVAYPNYHNRSKRNSYVGTLPTNYETHETSISASPKLDSSLLDLNRNEEETEEVIKELNKIIGEQQADAANGDVIHHTRFTKGQAWNAWATTSIGDLEAEVNEAVGGHVTNDHVTKEHVTGSNGQISNHVTNSNHVDSAGHVTNNHVTSGKKVSAESGLRLESLGGDSKQDVLLLEQLDIANL